MYDRDQRDREMYDEQSTAPSTWDDHDEMHDEPDNVQDPDDVQADNTDAPS